MRVMERREGKVAALTPTPGMIFHLCGARDVAPRRESGGSGGDNWRADVCVFFFVAVNACVNLPAQTALGL